MNIFLADLAHDFSVNNASLMVPLGIGYIKTHAVHHLADQVDIKLFKSPEKLLSAAAAQKPDVIGFTNYGWNQHLNLTIGKYLRSQFPDALIVAGGPNIDPDPTLRLNFLNLHDYLDFTIVDSGEEPFTNLLIWWRDYKGNTSQLPQNILWKENGKLRQTTDLKQLKQIDNIPSPYLSGHLDEFLDDGMVPLLETNRGCPFKCTFCAWGMASKDVVRRFPLETSLGEIEYIGRKSKARHWIIADANFGILKRDVDIAQSIRAVKDQYGTPQTCDIWLAKNTTDRNLQIAAILGDMAIPVMAIQSMSPIVLEKIKRDNIRSTTYIEYQKKFHDQGNKTYSDLIVPLPGETLESHIDGLKQMFEFGVDIIVSHSMRLLAGAETNSQETRKTYNFKTRYRLIHGDAGMYRAPNGTALRAFECEESLRSTNTMNEHDMFYLRKLHFLVELCWNFELYKPLLQALKSYKTNPLDILQKLLEEGREGGSLYSFWAHFERLSHEEWFDSEDELREYFSGKKNFQKLVGNHYEKLNILFTTIALRDYKKKFDKAIKQVVCDLDIIPDNILQQLFSYTFCRFPQLDSEIQNAEVRIASNLLQIKETDGKHFRPSSDHIIVHFSSSRRRELVRQAALNSQDRTLSKILNTQGMSLRDLALDSENSSVT